MNWKGSRTHSWSNSWDYSSTGLEKTVAGQLVSTIQVQPEA